MSAIHRYSVIYLIKFHKMNGDGAYDTKHCRQVIADREAHAVIPPRKNAKPWKDKQASSIEE